MPNQTPNFALPGLMAISRPELERQRTSIRLQPHRIQNSHWSGFTTYGGPLVGALSYDGALLVHGDQILTLGGIFEMLTEELPWRAYRSESPAVSVVMKIGRGLSAGDSEVYRLTSTSVEGAGSITIDDAAEWKFTAPRQPIPLGVGNYSWEIHVTDASGETRVCYVGELLITP